MRFPPLGPTKRKRNWLSSSESDCCARTDMLPSTAIAAKHSVIFLMSIPGILRSEHRASYMSEGKGAKSPGKNCWSLKYWRDLEIFWKSLRSRRLGIADSCSPGDDSGSTLWPQGLPYQAFP